jgi:nucleotide-binding universal stress UspA family protein
MTCRDVLLTALTYPDATPDRAIRSGVALAKRLGGQLTLLTAQADLPRLHNALANALIHLDRISDTEEARSAATAQLEARVARIAADIGHVAIQTQTVTAKLYDEADSLCRAARTRDVTLVPIGPAVLADRDLAETLLFGSGRPVLIYPEDADIVVADRFATVAIAWDGGRAAARAVADALPILERAEQVRIFIALGEKPQAVAGAAQDLVRHLRRHGVAAIADERAGGDPSIGRRISDYVAATQPDLLVMGAFGHARLHEFILGGATEAVLRAPPCPVLMSH